MPAKRPYVKARKRNRKMKVSFAKKPGRPKTYRGATGRKFASANNQEIFQFALAPQSTDFGAVAPVAGEQSKNTKVFLGALYDRNTTALTDGIRGRDITPSFYTDKYRVSFADIVADHADSAMGFILRMHVVQVRICPGKVPLTTSSWTAWSASVENLVNREVANSNLTADFLEFSKKNKNLRIISTTEVRPNRNNMIRKHISTGQTGEVYSCPPPMCYTVKHKVPQWKQRVEGPTLPGVSGTQTPMLENMWINCTVWTCDTLSSNTGTFKIEHSSKFYFKDS